MDEWRAFGAEQKGAGGEMRSVGKYSVPGFLRDPAQSPSFLRGHRKGKNPREFKGINSKDFR